MRNQSSILNVDIAGAAMTLAIAAASVFLWLRPAMDRARRIAELDDNHRATLAELAQAEAQRRTLEDRIEEARTSLAALNSGLPRARKLDDGIKQVVTLAVESGLQVDGIRPMAHRQTDDWDEYQFEIKATGRFPRFHQFCRLLEERAHFVDVPEYQIEHTGPPETPATIVSCAVRFYALPDAP